MATLTVRDAARKLGIKPRKVRLYISQHKLSARAAPRAPDRPRGDRVLLDADEVDTLAQIRARKRRERCGRASSPAPSTKGVTAGVPPAEEQPAADPVQAEVAGGVAAALPLPESILPATERAAWQATVFVQPLLEPLVVELHDARETIRRQAEELGVLRATVAELERRLRVTHNRSATAPSDRAVPSPTVSQPMSLASATPQRQRPIPLWQRAIAHLMG